VIRKRISFLPVIGVVKSGNMITFKQYFFEGFSSKLAGAMGAVKGGLKKIVGGAAAGADVASDVVSGVKKGAKGVVDTVSTDEVAGIEKIETYEDLRTVIGGIIKQKQQGEMSSTLVDTALSEIPGFDTATTLFDLLKAAGDRPDEEVDTQTGSVIDKLDVDDQLATIVDDKIEDNFLTYIQKKIESEDGPIPGDWNINNELKQYLASKFGGRTVTGDEQ
tara:strand:+ start:74 stop:733 length:660 start_codon:yes stop_codon:yes gene_type:complete